MDPTNGKKLNGILIPPLVVGDSAFPLQPWLLKPYGNAVLAPKQRYFNYRHSRAGMVTEECYGQLKGRWQILLRKCESHTEDVKAYTIACMVLHNTCIERGETISKKLNLTVDPITSQRQDREQVQELLQMTSCGKIRDLSHQASVIRDTLAEKLFAAKESGEVCKKKVYAQYISTRNNPYSHHFLQADRFKPWHSPWPGSTKNGE